MVSGNVLAHPVGAVPGFAIHFAPGGVNNTATGNVIYGWNSNNLIADDTGTASIAPGQINPAGLAAPARDVGAYMASLGQTATLAAFLAAARDQSKGDWNPAYTAQGANAYIRGGYVPVTPAGVSVTAASPTTAQVTWGAVEGAASYLVERSTDGVTWVAVAAPPAEWTSYRSAGLTPGEHYRYRVKAVNGIGPSEASEVVDAWPA
jgi:hypothetical protein